ncbi:MAG TPA: flagellar hook-associated protein FlgK [Longimicrobiales bacterium]|nr:flagellar hook-associated protein FlgK [Longimicrobiales bacterium]
MASIGAILAIANSALAASQRAVQITAHNIANAGTEGYTVQRIDQTASPPVNTPNGMLGTGVLLNDVIRQRDVLLDRTYRQESELAAGHGFTRDILGLIESAYAEPSEQGLGAQMDAFWSAWSELATNPYNDSARALVYGHGQQLAMTFNRLADRLDQIRTGVEEHLVDTVARINDIASQIAELNRQIVSVEVTGRTAADLRDTRDRLLDELSQLASIDVIEEENGAVGVIMAGARIVDRSRSFAIEARITPDGWEVGFVGRSRPIDPAGGRIGAAMRLLSETIPAQRARLDALAAALVSAVNEIHREGVNLAGETGLDFFDPTGTNAGSIRVADAIRQDPRRIAAGSGDVNGDPVAGANDIALRLAALRTTPHPDLGATFNDYYVAGVAELGAAVRHHTDMAEAQETLVAHTDSRRASVHGVSLDEELIRLIQFQAAYSAAARLVTAADEMLRTVLEM